MDTSDPKPRVLLVGLGITAPSALESLAEACEVVGVVRPVRAGAEDADPLARRVAQRGVPLLRDASPEAVEAAVTRLRPACVVLSSYDRILSPRLLAQCRFVNVHYSPLPGYRGRANVNWAIINDEPRSAVTIHAVAPSLDAGNILFQQHVLIGPRETVGELYERLNALQREHLGLTVLAHLNGYPGSPQDEADASWGCSRNPDDGLIDWSAPTRRIDCLVRGLGAPFPGAHTYLDGTRLVVWKADPVPSPPRYDGRVPGRVVEVCADSGHVDVLTGDGVMRLLEIQPEGRPAQAPAGLIRSVRATLGLTVPQLLARVRQLERWTDELVRAPSPLPKEP